MPPRTPRTSSRKQPKQARSTQLVEDVLQAAIQVLSREGAGRFTTVRVAQVAGVSIGSLYQYFPSKEAILFRLQLDEWRTTTALLIGILDTPDPPPLERLRTAITAFLRSECEEATLRTALEEAAPSFNDAPEAAFHRREAFRRFLAFWHELLPDTPPRQRRLALDMVMMTMESAGERISGDPRLAADVEAYARTLGDMVCAYLVQLRAARA
jgi:AcrR family transcriptional regulator